MVNRRASSARRVHAVRLHEPPQRRRRRQRVPVSRQQTVGRRSGQRPCVLRKRPVRNTGRRLLEGHRVAGPGGARVRPVQWLAGGQPQSGRFPGVLAPTLAPVPPSGAKPPCPHGHCVPGNTCSMLKTIFVNRASFYMPRRTPDPLPHWQRVTHRSYNDSSDCYSSA